MDDEKLALLVQEKEFLYNKFNPHYKNAEKKKAAWREIGLAMGVSDKLCLRRWTSLRDRYVGKKKFLEFHLEVDLDKDHSGLSKRIGLLDPYIIPRPMRCSENILREIAVPSSPSSSLSGSPQLLHETLDLSVSSAGSESPLPSNLWRKRRKNNAEQDVDRLFAEALETFKKACSNPEESTHFGYNETLKGFGQMILSAISTMSTAKQTRAIEEVTALVMRIKMEPE